MRGIMLLAGGSFYITDSPLTLDEQSGCYTASMPAGGLVSVPTAGLIAFEIYDDFEIEAFRRRIDALEADKAAQQNQS